MRLRLILLHSRRSLVTTLRAAEKFDIAHLSTPEIVKLIDGAKFFYVGGFFLTHGTASALALAQKSFAANKVCPTFTPFEKWSRANSCILHETFAINLSAPFIPQFFGDNLKQILPYSDIVIGNESEAASWAQANDIKVHPFHCAHL